MKGVYHTPLTHAESLVMAVLGMPVLVLVLHVFQFLGRLFIHCPYTYRIYVCTCTCMYVCMYMHEECSVMEALTILVLVLY